MTISAATSEVVPLNPSGLVTVREEPFGSEDAVRLRAAARIERAQLGALRPPIDPLVAPHGLVAHLVARDHFGTAVGCGALIAVDDGVVEIQRFYVRYDARGIGVGVTLMAELEAAATNSAAAAIVVETTSALGGTVDFLLRAGYQHIAPWGPYRESKTSLCFSKLLIRTTSSA